MLIGAPIVPLSFDKFLSFDISWFHLGHSLSHDNATTKTRFTEIKESLVGCL